jgi:hypothetical protein
MFGIGVIFKLLFITQETVKEFQKYFLDLEHNRRCGIVYLYFNFLFKSTSFKIPDGIE